MKILLCTNNLVGFLSAVFAFFKTETGADTIAPALAERSFLDEYTEISEDTERALAVKSGIIKKGGGGFYLDVADAYLSCNPQKEQILLDYLKLFFKIGTKIITMYDRPEVIAFNDMLNKVRHEAHRVSAFIRLMELSNGGYYGYFSSDNDILEKIMPVLIPRFNSQQFAVHDYKRGKMGVYDGKSCEYMLVEGGAFIELSEMEKVFQALWKQYHQTVSIKERENPRLQRQFLPKKYRHFMHEF